jgi:hypothetical protein
VSDEANPDFIWAISRSICFTQCASCAKTIVLGLSRTLFRDSGVKRGTSVGPECGLWVSGEGDT